MCEVVKFNVGGKLFYALESTIRKREGFLKNVVEKTFPPIKLEDDSYFIDHDPIYFQDVLNYLRGVQTGNYEAQKYIKYFVPDMTFNVTPGTVKCVNFLDVTVAHIVYGSHRYKIKVRVRRDRKLIVTPDIAPLPRNEPQIAKGKIEVVLHDDVVFFICRENYIQTVVYLNKHNGGRYRYNDGHFEMDIQEDNLE